MDPTLLTVMNNEQCCCEALCTKFSGDLGFHFSWVCASEQFVDHVISLCFMCETLPDGIPQLQYTSNVFIVTL